MLASQLIKELQTRIEKDGDHLVKVVDPSKAVNQEDIYTSDVEAIAVFDNEGEGPIDHFLICDRNTFFQTH